jgi:hypothetical protein
MKDLISLLSGLLLLTLAAIAAIVSTFLFIGVGYILSIILPLSLFEGAALAVGSSFVLVFSIAAVSIGRQVSRHGFFIPRNNLDDEDDEDDFDEEDESEEYEKYEDGNVSNPRRIAGNAVKIGRNAPCPCGSGLKYKRCCGK